MTILAVVMLTIGVWSQRLLGAFVVGPLLERRPTLTRAAGLIPAAVVMAVIVSLTITRGGDLVFDERIVGLVAAAFFVWRKAPFIVVVAVAAVTTSLLRVLL